MCFMATACVIPEAARLVKEEQFGPVLPVMRYDDPGGTIWTSGEAVAKRLDTGAVWVKRDFDLRFDIPFGGARKSGIGRQQGMEGLLKITQAPIINIALA